MKNKRMKGMIKMKNKRTYGNCLIIAILEKLKRLNTKVYLIKPSINPGGHMHIMWKDKDGNNYHFTSDETPKGIHTLLYEGYKEQLLKGTIEKLRGIRIL